MSLMNTELDSLTENQVNEILQKAYTNARTHLTEVDWDIVRIENFVENPDGTFSFLVGHDESDVVESIKNQDLFDI